MRSNLAALDSFAKVIKMMGHIELRCRACLILLPGYLYDLEHGFRIHEFKPTWPCLIVEWNFLIHLVTILWSAAPLPFLQCLLFGCCCCGIMTHFKVVKYKLPNYITLHIHLCGFQIRHAVKWYVCQHTNYPNTTNHNSYLSQLELLQSCDACTTN